MLCAFLVLIGLSYCFPSRLPEYLPFYVSKQEFVSTASHSVESIGTCFYRLTRANSPLKSFGKIDGFSALAGLKNRVSLSKKLDFWTYELTLDSGPVATLAQLSASESISLGSFAREDAEHGAWVLENGKQCEQVPGQPFRTSQLSFVCNSMLQESFVIEGIEENESCHYHVIVSTDLVCGDLRFPVISSEAFLDFQSWISHLSFDSINHRLHCRAWSHSSPLQIDLSSVLLQLEAEFPVDSCTAIALDSQGEFPLMTSRINSTSWQGSWQANDTGSKRISMLDLVCSFNEDSV